MMRSIPPSEIKHILANVDWHAADGPIDRHLALLNALESESPQSVFFALDFVRTLHRNQNPTVSAVCEQDMDWIRGRECRERLSRYKKLINPKTGRMDKPDFINFRRELSGFPPVKSNIPIKFENKEKSKKEDIPIQDITQIVLNAIKEREMEQLNDIIKSHESALREIDKELKRNK